jgi:hypothetical protein
MVDLACLLHLTPTPLTDVLLNIILQSLYRLTSKICAGKNGV